MDDLILGLDPANAFGWAVLTIAGDQSEVIETGVEKLNKRKGQHPGRRLEYASDFLYQLKRTHPGITLIAYEDAAFGSRNGNTSARHSELAGAILLAAAGMELPVRPQNIRTMKAWLTGDGNAKKMEVIRKMKNFFGLDTTDDNIADANLVARFTINQLEKEKKTNG